MYIQKHICKHTHQDVYICTYTQKIHFSHTITHVYIVVSLKGIQSEKVVLEWK